MLEKSDLTQSNKVRQFFVINTLSRGILTHITERERKKTKTSWNSMGCHRRLCYRLLCMILTFDILTSKSNQHVYEPTNTSVTKIHWFLICGVVLYEYK